MAVSTVVVWIRSGPMAAMAVMNMSAAISAAPWELEQAAVRQYQPIDER